MAVRRSRMRRSRKSPCKYGRKKSMRHGCKSKPGRKRRRSRRKSPRRVRKSRRKSVRKSRRKSVRKSVRRSRRKPVRRSRRKPVRRPNLSVRTRPITREELENRTYRPFVQLGEKVDGEMKWKAPTKTVIKYMENANMAGEEGMDVGEGWGFTFGSFGDMGPGIYGRYGGQSEYAMRVLEQAHSYGYRMGPAAVDQWASYLLKMSKNQLRNALEVCMEQHMEQRGMVPLPMWAEGRRPVPYHRP